MHIVCTVSLTLASVLWQGRLAAFDWGSPHFLSVSLATKHCHCSPASCQDVHRNLVTLCFVHSSLCARSCSAIMWKWVFLPVWVCILLSAHWFVCVKAFIQYIAVCFWQSVCSCLCVYRVVFSVCGSSAVRFPVLPPPPPPPPTSSLFPLSDLGEGKKRYK